MFPVGVDDLLDERVTDDIRLLEERVRLANDYIAKTFNV